MNRISLRRSVLRANAAYLGIAAVVSFFTLDLRAVLFNQGPERILLGDSTLAAIGFIEAHGLALILAIVFWSVAPARFWHAIAAATSSLLGICNLTFWEGFVISDSVAMGVVATSLHLAFGATQIVLAATSTASRAIPHTVTPVTARPA